MPKIEIVIQPKAGTMLSRRASAASLGWGILLLGWGIGCIVGWGVGSGVTLVFLCTSLRFLAWSRRPLLGSCCFRSCLCTGSPQVLALVAPRGLVFAQLSLHDLPIDLAGLAAHNALYHLRGSCRVSRPSRLDFNGGGMRASPPEASTPSSWRSPCHLLHLVHPLLSFLVGAVWPPRSA